MSALVDLRKPQLQSVDANGFQNLHLEGSKLVVAQDGEFNSVSISGLDADRTINNTKLQNVSSDAGLMTITSDVSITGNLKIDQGVLENLTTELRVSDAVKITSDSQSVPALDIQSSNTVQDPVRVQHAGSDIFKISTSGTITNSNIQQIESDLATETQARIDAISTEEQARQSTDSALDVRLTSAEASITDHSSRIATEEANVDTLQSEMLTAQADIDAVEARMATAEGEIAQLESDLAQEASDRASTDGALSGRCDDLEAKTIHLSVAGDVSTFSGASQVKWHSDESYFAVKHRTDVNGSGASVNTIASPLNFKSHQYSIDGDVSKQYGCYEITMQDKSGSVSAPFFNAKLVLGSAGAIIYPVASYKVNSHSYDFATSTLTLNFDAEHTNAYVLSWMMCN